jgi:hypothetical protein
LDDAAIKELSDFIGDSEPKRRAMFDVLSHDSIDPYVRWRGWYESYFEGLNEASKSGYAPRTIGVISVLENYPQSHGDADMEWALLYFTARLKDHEGNNLDPFRTTILVEQSPEWTLKIRDKSLVDLLCRQPKDAERIVELVIAKPTYRAAELELILSDHGYTTPLIEGAL